MTAIERARFSLSEHYEGSLSTRVAAFDAWLVALDGEDAADVDEAIRRSAHQLRGTGTSFGFPGITDHGAAVELATADELPAALGRLIDEIRRALVELAAQNRPGRP
jgi:hypothetical protein